MIRKIGPRGVYKVGGTRPPNAPDMNEIVTRDQQKQNTESGTITHGEHSFDSWKFEAIPAGPYAVVRRSCGTVVCNCTGACMEPVTREEEIVALWKRLKELKAFPTT